MVLKVYITPSFLKIDGDDEIALSSFLDELDRYFAVEDKSYRPRNVRFWSPKIHRFFDRKTCLLPTGLLSNFRRFVHQYCETHGVVVDIQEIEMFTKKKFDITDKDIDESIPNFKIRDYQRDAIKSFFNAGCRGLLEGSVASGKTLIFASITKLVQEPTLIIVGKVDLVHGGMNAFIKEYGFDKKDIGIIQGNNVMERRINFCTIQSLSKISDINRYKFLVFDEAHHCAADTYQSLLMASRAPYRLGVSGTIRGLDPLDFLKVKSFIGDIFYKIETKTLVDNGVLAEPMVYVVEIRSPAVDIFAYGNDWTRIENDLIVNNEKRNDIIADLVNNNLPLPCLVLVRRIQHGEILASKIRNSVFLRGESEIEDRKKYTYLMDSGKKIPVIATDIFNEGVNMRGIRSLVIAGALKSFVVTKQRAGRGLRKHGDKSNVIIIDFFDMTHPVLERQSQKRINIYEKDGFKIIGHYTENDYVCMKP